MMLLLTLPRGTVLRRSLDSVEEGGEGEVGEDAFIACHSRLQEEEEEEEEVRKEGRKEGILRVKSMHTHAQDTHTHTHTATMRIRRHDAPSTRPCCREPRCRP